MLKKPRQVPKDHFGLDHGGGMAGTDLQGLDAAGSGAGEGANRTPTKRPIANGIIHSAGTDRNNDSNFS